MAHKSGIMPKGGMTRATLNVSLTPELLAFIAAQVASGRYGTASEVVRAALRSLEGQSNLSMKQALNEGALP